MIKLTIPKQAIINKLAVFVFLSTLVFTSNAQDNAHIGLDFRAGMPTILSSSTPKLSPYGGMGLRYSFNHLLSAQADVDGGGITGLSKTIGNGYFRYTFVQPSLKVNFNMLGLLPDRGERSKLNLNFTAGVAGTLIFYDADRANNGGSERGYFTIQTGINARYYINEMVDFIAGTNFNFPKTTAIDNIRTGNKDVFMLSYIGLGVKFLPAERVQSVEWKHLPLEFASGPITATKQIVGNLEKQLKDAEKKGNDSITTVLRREIIAVDSKVNNVNSKVDSIDNKLNIVLELLNNMNAQATAKHQADSIAKLPKTKGAKGKKNTKTTPAKQPAKVVPIPTKETSTNTGGNNTTEPNNNTNPTTDNTGNTDNTKPVTPTKSNGLASTIIPKEQIVDQKNVKESYAIVVGSFVQDQNALNTKERYVEKGWDAHILGNARSQYKRIVIFSNNYYEAAKIVTELRKTEQPDVWMLDINTGKGVYIK